MAQALRLALERNLPKPPGSRAGLPWRWLSAIPVLLIFGPVLPGLYWAVNPALDPAVWQSLWFDGQWVQALRSTLVSSVIGTVLACGMAALLATLHYPSQLWMSLQRRLPLLLSVPRADWLLGGALLALALATRMWRIEDPAAIVFDESHFTKFSTW